MSGYTLNDFRRNGCLNFYSKGFADFANKRFDVGFQGITYHYRSLNCITNQAQLPAATVDGIPRSIGKATDNAKPPVGLAGQLRRFVRSKLPPKETNPFSTTWPRSTKSPLSNPTTAP